MPLPDRVRGSHADLPQLVAGATSVVFDPAAADAGVLARLATVRAGVLGACAAVAAVIAVLAAALPATVLAASPGPGTAAATSSPCPRSLKFAGSLYLDTGEPALPAAVGPQVGETEPNPAQCALPDRLKIFRHNGHGSTDEVIYYLDPRTPEVFRSAGQTGFPGSTLVRVLVLLLVAGILLFAAAPAILGHLRQPPVGVGRDDTDWIDDVKLEAESGALPPDREPPPSA
jgi:hypothetical protein